MSEVTVTIDGVPEGEGVVAEAVPVEVVRTRCDGACGGFILDELVDESVYTTEDGREGHVCGEPCAAKFEAGETARLNTEVAAEQLAELRASEQPLSDDEWPDDVPRDDDSQKAKAKK